jgi:hypothetical protein
MLPSSALIDHTTGRPGLIPYTAPALELKAFNCPHCQAFAHQSWRPLGANLGAGYQTFQEVKLSMCGHCGEYGLWLNDRMLYPTASTAPPPNPDLPEDIKPDYEEARSILGLSPRGAAALLRLAVQKLCQDLGEQGDLNNAIGNLVRKGLPVQIQQALDAVRVIGNNAVHPGQIDLNDDPQTAARLFELVNLVTEVMITQPKKVQEMYERLPDTSKEQIAKRDNQSS